MSSILLRKNVSEKHNSFVDFINHGVARAFSWGFRHKKISLLAAGGILAATLFSTTWLGTEFLPQLNEGALWVEAKLPMSSSINEKPDAARNNFLISSISLQLATLTWTRLPPGCGRNVLWRWL